MPMKNMKKRLAALSVWIILTVVPVDVVWWVFLIYCILDLDTLIPNSDNIHITFLSLSFFIVILATL